MPANRRLLSLTTAALALALAVATIAGGQRAAIATSGTKATPARGSDCTLDPAAPKRQLRAEWIASVVNIDWPSLSLIHI